MLIKLLKPPHLLLPPAPTEIVPLPMHGACGRRKCRVGSTPPLVLVCIAPVTVEDAGGSGGQECQ